jgi:hypothetical protein
MIEYRQYLFTTMYLNNVEVGRRAGIIPESGIRDEICADMFRSPIARKLWEIRRERAKGLVKQSNELWAIFEAAYEKGVAQAVVPRSSRAANHPPDDET